MTKIVHAGFDGKTFVPDDASGLPAGANVTFVVSTEPAGTGKTRGQQLAEALGGFLPDETADDMLRDLAERKFGV